MKNCFMRFDSYSFCPHDLNFNVDQFDIDSINSLLVFLFACLFLCVVVVVL